MLKFRDVDRYGKIVTEAQLYRYYCKNKEEQPEEYDYNFKLYVHNCMFIYGGTLEQIKKRKR